MKQIPTHHEALSIVKLGRNPCIYFLILFIYDNFFGPSSEGHFTHEPRAVTLQW